MDNVTVDDIGGEGRSQGMTNDDGAWQVKRVESLQHLRVRIGVRVGVEGRMRVRVRVRVRVGVRVKVRVEVTMKLAVRLKTMVRMRG